MPDCKTSVCVKLMYILFFLILMNRRIGCTALASTTVIMPFLGVGTVSGAQINLKSVWPHTAETSAISSFTRKYTSTRVIFIKTTL